jgi:glucan phosphoethanolaminetransferase (alkaline phosphatase superfamily)
MDRNFADRAQKLTLAIVVLSIIGLITIPLFPWFGIESEARNYDTEEDVTITYYTYGNSGYLHMIAESNWGGDEIEDLDGDVSMISLCLWISLFLGVIALGGVALYRTGRLEGAGHLLLLIGAIVIIFSIIAMVSHITFFIHLEDFKDETIEGSEVIYGYNFFPLIMIILLLITSLIYIAMIVPFSARALSQTRGVMGYGAPYQYPQSQQPYSQYTQQPSTYQQPSQQQYQQQPPQQYQKPYAQPQSKPSQQPTEVNCPTCNYQFAVNIRSLPQPIKCPQCGTRGFIE